MALHQGQVLEGRYRIVRLIGQGGFGAVYRAWDISLGRVCAVKENLEITPDAVRQFQREARILAGLNHPHLPRVTDYFTLPGQGQYLVMDFVEGQSLADKMKQRSAPFQEDEVLPWIEQVCRALTYLHTQNPPVIHRDIKPQNIIITPSNQAMLVDFGIAKLYDPHQTTTTGARAISSGFSPPEQYGGGTTDFASDIYALGATLYSLLTNQTPPDALTRLGRSSALIAPKDLCPTLSPQINHAILTSMEMDGKKRFSSVESFRIALTCLPVAQIQTSPMTGTAARSELSLFLPRLRLLFLSILRFLFLPNPIISNNPTYKKFRKVTWKILIILLIIIGLCMILATFYYLGCQFLPDLFGSYCR